MKVFISWSGDRSKHIANALRFWLPKVIQAVKPFISDRDIAKGTRGAAVLAAELEGSSFGICCLTPENIESKWINFEAGALSKLRSASVCTYLYELQPSDIEQPLAQFQHTKAKKGDTLVMLKDMNRLLGDQALPDSMLEEVFETWWPKLEEQLENVPEKPDHEIAPDPRSNESKIDETVELVRAIADRLLFNHPSQIDDQEQEAICFSLEQLVTRIHDGEPG